MKDGKELQTQSGRAVSAEVHPQTGPANPVVIDAEFSEIDSGKAAPTQNASGAEHAHPSRHPKLGAQIDAWLREGAKDLWNAIVPAFPQNQHYVDEQGTPLNPTPQVVTDQMGLNDYDPSWAAHRAQFAAKDRDQELGR